MAEQMGWEDIKDDEIPLEFPDLDDDCQSAIQIFNMLPDKIEGMSGRWLGKEMAGVGEIMDILEIQNKKDVLYYLKTSIDVADDFYGEQHKSREMSARNRRG